MPTTITLRRQDAIRSQMTELIDQLESTPPYSMHENYFTVKVTNSSNRTLHTVTVAYSSVRGSTREYRMYTEACRPIATTKQIICQKLVDIIGPNVGGEYKITPVATRIVSTGKPKTSPKPAKAQRVSLTNRTS